MYRLHEVLLDCTCYENSALAEASMGLLIRTFEQQQTLLKNAHSVQLLSKKRMKAPRYYYPGEKPYRMIYMEDPFGNILEIYSHSYELHYASGAYTG